jgi:TfoX/Sxy family transcriptional regulator of competence genes
VAYSEELADRVRAALADRSGVAERRMFGGLAFMLAGRMFAGVIGERLVVRLGADAGEHALAEPHTLPMDFTGRPLKGYVYVTPPGLASGRDVQQWLARAIEFVESLPPK